MDKDSDIREATSDAAMENGSGKKMTAPPDAKYAGIADKAPYGGGPGPGRPKGTPVED